MSDKKYLCLRVLSAIHCTNEIGHEGRCNNPMIDELAQLRIDCEALREHLWRHHGHTGLYGDDGEMQCSSCVPYWDYKRMPINELLIAVALAGRK